MGYRNNATNLKSTILLYHYMRVQPVLYHQPQASTDPLTKDQHMGSAEIKCHIA
jgi:hypothetical protein